MELIKLCAISHDDQVSHIECDVSTGEVIEGDITEFLYFAETSTIPLAKSVEFIFNLLRRVHSDECEIDLNYGEAKLLYEWLGTTLAREGEDTLFSIGVYEDALEMSTFRRKKE